MLSFAFLGGKQKGSILFRGYWDVLLVLRKYVLDYLILLLVGWMRPINSL